VLPADQAERLERMIAEGEAASYSVTPDGGFLCVVLHDFKLRPGYNVEAADLLVRLPPGFPDAAPDMFWIDPPIARTDGVGISAADQYEMHLGRRWQRFSRHLAGGEWRAGVDSIESYLALIRKALAEGFAKAA
jgi:hypothetical protein